MVSGRKLVAIVVPIIAAVAIIAGIFALPFQPSPAVNTAGGNSTQTENPSCTSISGRITNLVVNIDGEGTNETRKAAAALLVNEYCARPQLEQEISAMAGPGSALVAYGCDAASGKIADANLQNSLQGYSTVYCESSLVDILEQSEAVMVEAEGFRESLLESEEEDGEGTGNNTASTNMTQVDAKLQEITDLAKSAKSLARSGNYYDAAMALDRSYKLFEELDQLV